MKSFLFLLTGFALIYGYFHFYPPKPAGFSPLSDAPGPKIIQLDSRLAPPDSQARMPDSPAHLPPVYPTQGSMAALVPQSIDHASSMPSDVSDPDGDQIDQAQQRIIRDKIKRLKDDVARMQVDNVPQPGYTQGGYDAQIADEQKQIDALQAQLH